MNKTLAALILLIGFTASLPALDVTVGPKLAVADMNLRGDGMDGVDNMLSASFAGGVFAALKLTPMIGIQPEISFNSFSVKQEISGNWMKWRFPVLSIPVYARFDFEVADSFGAYALIGPRFDLRLSDTANYKEEGGAGDDDQYPISNFNSLLFGIAGGGGVSLPVGPGILDAGIGVYFGFTELGDGSDVYPWDIDVQVAYGFPL